MGGSSLLFPTQPRPRRRSGTGRRRVRVFKFRLESPLCLLSYTQVDEETVSRWALDHTKISIATGRDYGPIL